MSDTGFHRKNHYVSQGYLKRWSSPDGQVWMYRTLVSHPEVELWKKASPRGIAYHAHLYTRIVAGQETDEVEKWLGREIEAPAEEPIRKATSDARLTRDDWRRLVRFLAAQDVRTPAWFEEQRRRWSDSLPSIMEKSLRNAIRVTEEAKQTGHPLASPRAIVEDAPLFRVTAKRGMNRIIREIEVDMPIGRRLWLSNMQQAINHTSAVLHQHKWTILRPPEGSSWPTSDNPVIRLNLTSRTEYNFRGGWGSKWSEILLPIGPQHLLYTQIDMPPPRRGHRMAPDHAEFVRRIIAEHADQLVFAVERDSDIPRMRPRVEDTDLFRRRREYWETWHEQQTAAERELSGGLIFQDE